MATFAVMSRNLVSNIIVADSKEIAEQVTGLACIEYTQENPAGIGWTYDGINFTPPTVETILDTVEVIEEPVIEEQPAVE